MALRYRKAPGYVYLKKNADCVEIEAVTLLKTRFGNEVMIIMNKQHKQLQIKCKLIQLFFAPRAFNLNTSASSR